jgi:hypothetical protein
VKLMYRPIQRWPGPLTEPRQALPFSATWTETLTLLERELDALKVDANPVLQMALTEADLRLDGDLRAIAKLTHPGVILTFEHPKHGPLSYPCDTFEGGNKWVSGRRTGTGRSTTRSIEGWQANVRAIALGLEALRKVERYGIAGHGEQYTGWKALGGGTPMPPASMTLAEAQEFIEEHAGRPLISVGLTGWEVRLAASYRRAAKALHPDAGGDAELFKQLQDAKRIIEEAS